MLSCPASATDNWQLTIDNWKKSKNMAIFLNTGSKVEKKTELSVNQTKKSVKSLQSVVSNPLSPVRPTTKNG